MRLYRYSENFHMLKNKPESAMLFPAFSIDMKGKQRTVYSSIKTARTGEASDPLKSKGNAINR